MSPDAYREFVRPYLCLLFEVTPGCCVHNLRDVLRRPLLDRPRRFPVALLRLGDFPPWAMVSQQARRWLAAGCFEAIVHDLRAVLRFADGRAPEPTAAIFDSRTLQSTPESGGRAGYDAAKLREGLQGPCRGRHARTPAGAARHVADTQDRDQVAALPRKKSR